MKNIYYAEEGLSGSGTFESVWTLGQKEAKEWLRRQTMWLTKAELDRDETELRQVGNFADLKKELESIGYDEDTIYRLIGYIAIKGTSEGFNFN